MKIRTVLGEVDASSLGVALPHEHICCYNEAAYAMAGASYLDKEELVRISANALREYKAQYGLTTFMDCTPLNIGRDYDLLCRVSERSEVNILASTGFYYTQECMFNRASSSLLAKYMLEDIKHRGISLIKCAIEESTLTPFDEKLLHAVATVHKESGLPIVLHTHAHRKNAPLALEIFFKENVSPSAITVGHLSDSDDISYVLEMAATGAYIGLDRIYDNPSEDYINKKVATVNALDQAGYASKILLSHDEQFFNGFEAEPHFKLRPRFTFSFEHIVPRLSRELARKILVENPQNMLLCKS